MFDVKQVITGEYRCWACHWTGNNVLPDRERCVCIGGTETERERGREGRRRLFMPEQFC